MTSFSDREKSFEKKFADGSRSLSSKLRRAATGCSGNGRPRSSGLSGAAVDDYVKAVRKADLLEKGDEDVLPQDQRRTSDEKGVQRHRRGAAPARWPSFWPAAVEQTRGRGQEQVASDRCGRQPQLRAGRSARVRIDLAVSATLPAWPTSNALSCAARGEHHHGCDIARPARQANVASVDPIWAAVPLARPRRSCATASRRSEGSSMPPS